MVFFYISKYSHQTYHLYYGTFSFSNLTITYFLLRDIKYVTEKTEKENYFENRLTVFRLKF